MKKCTAHEEPWAPEFLREELLKAFELLQDSLPRERLLFPEIGRLVAFYLENFPREIVVYFPAAGSLQSADLTGTFAIEVSPLR